MAVGARDFIDKLLVEKYAQEQVDNHTDAALVSRINAEDIMDMMNSLAYNYRGHLDITSQLNKVCYGINAKNAKYQSIPA